jgi:hypothetical protein
MAGAFEIATKAAIEEIIEAHAQKSKFGFILTNENFRNLADDFYQLLMNSRNLKAVGDRMFPGGPASSAPSVKGPVLPGGRNRTK